ncbi:RHS repeat-associated core domain-containing protein [Chryseobacterium piscicola]|nr:RHS repeat-associated core domain-containing protein [Chryseobacterium piscicola]
MTSGYGNVSYGWREYMPDLGRWNGIDQLAENYLSTSTYAYVANNPISLTDPDGRWIHQDGSIGQGPSTTSLLGPTHHAYMSFSMSDGMSYNSGAGGGGGGNAYNFTGNAAFSIFKHFATGGNMNNISFDNGYASWWTTSGSLYSSSGDLDYNWNVLHKLKLDKGEEESTWEKIWNSDFVRGFTGDFVNVGVGFSGIAGTGGGTSFELNWVIHGPEASILPAFTTTPSIGGGYNVDLTFNVGNVNYTGMASQITRSMLITNTRNGDIPTVWGAGSISAGGNLGLTGTVTRLNGGEFLVGGQVNVGLGLPAGPVPFNGSGGVSNTYLINDFYRKR